jgi:predicted nucleotidyltransferase
VNLSEPITSVIPGAYGPILAALFRTGVPLSGRQIAGLVEGKVSRSRVNDVLRELAAHGLVCEAAHPPAILYTVNRNHVAAEALEALVELRPRLLDRMRADIASWEPSAISVLLYGSVARGDGNAESDIDVLVIRPDAVSAGETTWRNQLDQFVDRVQAWSGNTCEVLEFADAEFTTAMTRGRKLERELRRDAICLGGEAPDLLLSKTQTRRS